MWMPAGLASSFQFPGLFRQEIRRLRADPGGAHRRQRRPFRLTTPTSTARRWRGSIIPTSAARSIFASGEVSKLLTVPIINDGLTNGPLFLNLVLSNAVPTNGLGIPSVAVLNIIDTTTVNETPGSPDRTYSSSAGFNDNVYALALQGDNKLLAGGDFTQANGVPRQRIARLNANGTLDAAFSQPPASAGANDSVRALAVQADGRISGWRLTFHQLSTGR